MTTHGSFSVFNQENRPVFEILSDDGYLSNRWMMVDRGRTVLYGMLAGGDSSTPIVQLIHNNKTAGYIGPGKEKQKDHYIFRTKKSIYIFRGNPYSGNYKLFSNLGKALEVKMIPGRMDQYGVKVTTSRAPLLLLAGVIGLTYFRLKSTSTSDTYY